MAIDMVEKQITALDSSNDERRWLAVQLRDSSADGVFYYAVVTTRIYCKPSCPSRHPFRSNVKFFDTADQAEQAGFRPCQRCEPRDAISPTLNAVYRVRQLIETLNDEPTLSELGEVVGLTPTYVQKMFKRTFGVSPKQYARAFRLERLKKELKLQTTVTNALYEAGYESSNGLYHDSSRQLGMNPAMYRDGGRDVQINYTLCDSTLGRLLVAATERGICAVRFGEGDELISELQSEYPSAIIQQNDRLLAPQAHLILGYLAGHQAALDLPLDVQATAFQARVWGALRAIPYGETRSYSQIANSIGAPRAVRAVARACAANPVALIVPCHRVIRMNNAMSGYRWGIERKKALLEQERRNAISS
jgi:AraC family transcriptional regulator, regulatory protein of adaptative response / methylated-DNA-[protein]-cysteine methyltransferase